MVIKTFIPTTQLFTLKSNLYDKMQTMLEDKALNKNIDGLWQKYRRAEYFSSQEWPCVQSANDDIRSVLQSKEWAQAVASREGKISYINADPFADLKPNAL